MALATRCPACHTTLRLEETSIGRRVRCSKCRHAFVVASVTFEQSTAEKATATVSPESTVPSGMQSSAAGPATTVPLGGGTRESPKQFGRFEIISVLGQGTYGQVFRASDPTLDRDVALKIPKFGSDQTRLVERFLREAKAAARLRHPNIVALFESGRVGDDYYIASEFVEGETLAARIEREPVSPTDAATWCRDLANALAYAHANGVVHRDIKPGNILMDRTGRPQITDFGLAKRIDEDATMTTEGGLLGTPAYMSPEQARGQTTKIGSASDQYSLGAVFYELLTGKRPYDGPPHLAIAKAAGNDPPPPPRSVRPAIPRDLEAICLHCLEKDPSRRYRGAQALADDLGRWLEGRSVRVRRIGEFERFYRWCRRNPILSVSLATTAGLLLAVSAGAFTRIKVQLQTVQAEASDLREQVRVSSDMRLANRWESLRGQAADLRASGKLGRRFKTLELLKQAAEIRWHDSLRDEAIACLGQLDARKTDSWQFLPENAIAPFIGRLRGSNVVAMGPEASWVAVQNNDNIIQILESRTGKRLFQAQTPCLLRYGRLTFCSSSRDGSRFAFSAGGKVRIWDFKQAVELPPIQFSDSGQTHPVLNPDGSLLVLEYDGRLAVWDLVTQKKKAEITAPKLLFPFLFNEMGVFFVTATRTPLDAGIQVWKVGTGAPDELRSFAKGENFEAIWDVVASGDGEWLALLCRWGRAVEVWNTLKETRLASIPTERFIVTGLALSHHGGFLASFEESQIKLWDLRRSVKPLIMEVEKSWAQFSRNEQALYAFSPSTVDRWEIETGQKELSIVSGFRSPVRSVAFSPDSKGLAATAPQSGELAIVDESTQSITHRIAVGPGGFGWSYSANMYSATGDRLSACLADHAVVVDTANTTVAAAGDLGSLFPGQGFEAGDGFQNGGIDASGKLILAMIRGSVVFFDARDFRILKRLGPFIGGAVSPALAISDGQIVATDPTWLPNTFPGRAGFESLYQLWDIQEDRPICNLKCRGSALALAFSPGAKWLVGGYWGPWEGDKVVHLWNTHTRAEVSFPAQHRATVTGIAFRPDAQVLATGSLDGTVKLWNLATRQCFATLPTGDAGAGGVSFSRDGSRLAVGCTDNTVRIWKLAAVRKALAEIGMDWEDPKPGSTAEESTESAAQHPAPEFTQVSYPQSVTIAPTGGQGSFFLDERSHSDVAVTPTPGGLEIHIPPGNQRHIRFAREYLPVLGGNFEITATYRPLVFPEPRQYFNNKITLSLRGLEGANKNTAVFQRVHHSGPGKHAASIYDADEGGPPSINISGVEPTGTFRLTRHGEFLKAEWAASEAGPFQEVGILKFVAGDVLPFLEAGANCSDDEVKVVFGNVKISADRIEGAELFGEGKAVTTIVEEFKGAYDKTRFRMSPDPPKLLTESTGQGLRVLADGSSGRAMTFAFNEPFNGDLDATLSYADLVLPARAKGTDNSLHLVLQSKAQLLAVHCIRSPAQTQKWGMFRQQPWFGLTSTEEVKSSAGRLRLVRSGSYGFCFAGEGESGPYQLIWAGLCGKQSGNVEVHLNTNDNGDHLSLTLRRLEIRFPAK
jgi:predicted Zn finger-like uncharacterized protein